MTLKGMTTTGRNREIAKLEYEYSGIELKKELAKLDPKTDEEKAKQQSQVEFDEGVIDRTEFDKRCAIVDKPWVEVKKMEVHREMIPSKVIWNLIGMMSLRCYVTGQRLHW